MTTISITLARNEDGSVNEEATLVACQTAIRQFVAERETEQATIAAAVEGVFDSLNGARANMPYVVGSALRALNAQPENFKTLGDRVSEYLREHAGDRESGKDFGIIKGKGGGVVRWSDQPAPKPAAAK